MPISFTTVPPRHIPSPSAALGELCDLLSSSIEDLKEDLELLTIISDALRSTQPMTPIVSADYTSADQAAEKLKLAIAVLREALNQTLSITSLARSPSDV